MLCVRGCLTKRWHSPALERCWIVLLSMVVVKAVLVPLLGMFANFSTLFEFPGEASSQNDNINVPLTSSQNPISRQSERVQCVSPWTAISMVEVPRPKRRSRISEDIKMAALCAATCDNPALQTFRSPSVRLAISSVGVPSIMFPSTCSHSLMSCLCLFISCLGWTWDSPRGFEATFGASWHNWYSMFAG